MRVFPRIGLPRLGPLARRLGGWRRHLTPARAALAVEAAGFAAALAFLLTGERAARLDRWGERADFAALALVSALFALVHLLGRRHLVPRLERYFSPAAYDEHRILFDLGQEARAARTIEQLFGFIAERVREAFETDHVALFARDDATGDFVCRIATRPAPPAPATANDARATADAPRATDAPRAGGNVARADDCSHLRLPRGAFVLRRLRHLQLPLALTPEDFDAWARAYAAEPESERLERERELATLREIRSSLLVQIRIKEQLVGVLSVGPRRRARHRYTQADAELLMSVASQLAFVIENSKLTERIVAEEKLRRELALAAEVQRRLFPARAPASAVAELAGFCQPARGVGGDYYDFLSFGNGQLGVAVADVSGKGMSAALLMANVQASLRSQALAHNAAGAVAGRTLADLVAAMNRLLCDSTGPASYVTFFYGQLDERTRRFTYVNAGHNPPLLIHMRERDAAPRAHDADAQANGDANNGANNGANNDTNNDTNNGANGDANGDAGARPATYVRLETGGMVVGLFEHVGYEEEELQLRPGDLLLAYTDGVTEASDPTGEEFGEARLQDSLAAAGHLPADSIRDDLVARVESWCAGAPQHDDLTFVVLKVK